MGCTMSKKITFTLDEDILSAMDTSLTIDDVVINQAIQHYLHAEQPAMDHTHDIHTKMQTLEQDKERIEQEKKDLEIEYACLKQQKHKLESRINDLSELYPSASVLLGKKPVASYSRTRLFKNKLRKRK